MTGMHRPVGGSEGQAVCGCRGDRMLETCGCTASSGEHGAVDVAIGMWGALPRRGVCPGSRGSRRVVEDALVCLCVCLEDIFIFPSSSFLVFPTVLPVQQRSRASPGSSHE